MTMSISFKSFINAAGLPNLLSPNVEREDLNMVWISIKVWNNQGFSRIWKSYNNRGDKEKCFTVPQKNSVSWNMVIEEYEKNDIVDLKSLWIIYFCMSHSVNSLWTLPYSLAIAYYNLSCFSYENSLVLWFSSSIHAKKNIALKSITIICGSQCVIYSKV